MSRSKPDANEPNPSQRWLEWDGSKGVVRYYDKDTKQNVVVGSDFVFLLLDQLGGVGGWHKTSDCAMYSNAVKDVRSGVLVVKTKKDGIVAEGLYKDIKDRVNAMGGYYEAQCYVGFKREDGTLAIGCLRFKGAALHAWAEFAKAHRADLYEKAVRINGYTEGKKGQIVYRVPILASMAVSPATNTEAVALDAVFQKWLEGYLGRSTSEQAAPADEHAQPEPEPVPVGAYAGDPPPTWAELEEPF